MCAACSIAPNQRIRRDSDARQERRYDRGGDAQPQRKKDGDKKDGDKKDGDKKDGN